MEIQEFSRQLSELMPSFLRHVVKVERNALSRGDVTLPQYWALEFMNRQQGCSMSQLAAELGMSSSAVTSVVDRLVQLELVERHPGDEDRRRVEAQVTGAGRALLQRLYAEKQQTLTNLFARVSRKDRNDYLRVIRLLVATLEAEENGDNSNHEHIQDE